MGQIQQVRDGGKNWGRLDRGGDVIVVDNKLPALPARSLEVNRPGAGVRAGGRRAVTRPSVGGDPLSGYREGFSSLRSSAPEKSARCFSCSTLSSRGSGGRKRQRELARKGEKGG